MKVKIGGVPEHFNFPWHYALSKGYFTDAGIEVDWQDYPGGTGAMASALKNNDLDMALLLTEGAVKEIVGGADFKIARSYVQSPLLWGIHTSILNKTASLNDLTKMRYAISRFGSGSHLMAYVHAKANGVVLKEKQMVVVGDLKGARDSLKEQSADLFLWERFMTKPLVDTNEFELLGKFPTPWPCFMLVAKNSLVHEHRQTVLTICSVLDKSLKELSHNNDLARMIAQMYDLIEKDVVEWLKNTKWNTDFNIKNTVLQEVVNALFSLGMLDYQAETNTLVHDTVTLI